MGRSFATTNDDLALAKLCDCVQVAVIRETDAKGPFCTLVMSVVVIKDVLLFVCFAINVEFARVVRNLYVT